MEDLEPSFVVNRGGEQTPVRFDLITDRNQGLCSSVYGRPLEFAKTRLPALTQQVVRRFKNGMTTHELDMLTASVCAEESSLHRDFADLAARILVSDLQKRTAASFTETVRRLAGARDAGGAPTGRLSEELAGLAERAGGEIERRIDYSRDFRFNCFGIQTMIRSYLLREGGEGTPTAERPQHAYMRVALVLAAGQADGRGHEAPAALLAERLERAFEVYDLLSTHRLTHASPTMFNAGTRYQQLASCFLLSVADDLDSILQVVKDSGTISKLSGGVGVCLSRMRAQGARIRSTGGRSSGVPRLLANLNGSQLYVNQGGLRPGAYATYLEPWHADVFGFLRAGRPTGAAVKAPDIKAGLWVNDLFMEKLLEQIREESRAKAAGEAPDPAAGAWHLFSPDRAPGLVDAHGEAFRALYEAHAAEGRAAQVVRAMDIAVEWFETVCSKGFPYILFKDHVNRKSNLSHHRTITNSNLCAEITIPCFYDPEEPARSEYGTCNLAALPLASFVVPDARAENPGRVRVDWAALAAAAGVAVRNLDRVIDLGYYPVEAARRSNLLHRPVAVGVIGLADALARFRYAFGSPEAQALDRALHAAIYLGAMRASAALGAELGSFGSFEGSAAQRGLLQPDLWVAAGDLGPGWAAEVEATTGGAVAVGDWDALREACRRHLRNGYVTADMPTATSSQATGQNECFEPFTSNLYTRKTLAGEFIVLNPFLLEELEARGLWDKEMRRDLLASGGSVQGLPRVPEEVQGRFLTARELDQVLITQHAKARNPFLSQTQSLNYFFGEPRLDEFLRVIIKGWQAGLTTGSYYIHTQPASGAAKTSAPLFAAPENGGGAPPGEAPSCPAGGSAASCEACSA